MDDGNHELIENAECDEALLGIVEAIVFVGVSGTFKDSWRVDRAVRYSACAPRHST